MGNFARKALEHARLVGPFDRAIELSLSARDRLNFRRITNEQKTVKTGRRRVIRELTRISAKLKPMQEKLFGVLDTASPARTLRIPLINFLVKKFNYPDTTLPVKKSNSLAARVAPAAENLKQLRFGLNKQNRNIVRSIRKSTNPTLKQKCWEMPLSEYNKGWLTEPVPVTKLDL